MSVPSRRPSPTNLPRNALGRYSLERTAYVDPQVFARERERIFARCQLLVGRESDWDSRRSFRTSLIAGQPVLILRNESGELRGFHNVCRHRGAQLVVDPEGCLAKGVVTCPYHAWSYDLGGGLVGAPNMADVDGFRRESFGLADFPLQAWQGFVLAQLVADQPALRIDTAAMDAIVAPWGLGQLRPAARLRYVVRANWKLLFQNYSECYHCPCVHPLLNRLTPYQGSSNAFQSGPILGGPMWLADDIQTMSTTGQRIAPPLPGLSADELRQVHYYTIFPSLFLSLHPDYCLVHQLNPLEVDSTEVHCDLLVHPDSLSSAEFDPSPAVDFWDLTNRQDWEVCERVQLGARSMTFRPGPYSNLESIVAAFDSHYLSAMG